MTLREKVGQLFCVRPEAFDVALEWDTYEKIASYQLREVTPQMKKVNAEYPVGGIILFSHNIQDPGFADGAHGSVLLHRKLVVVADTGHAPAFFVDTILVPAEKYYHLT